MDTESDIPCYVKDPDDKWGDGDMLFIVSSSQKEALFTVEKSGIYRLTVDTGRLNIRTKYLGDGKPHFYGCGDVFKWGWEYSAAEEFTTTDQKIWTWTGDLKQEDFVILASRTGEGGYVWDKSADGNAAPAGQETVWTMKAMDDVFDRNAYSFTISKAGNYTLTINGETLKLTIKCNDPWE